MLRSTITARPKKADAGQHPLDDAARRLDRTNAFAATGATARTAMALASPPTQGCALRYGFVKIAIEPDGGADQCGSARRRMTSRSVIRDQESGTGSVLCDQLLAHRSRKSAFLIPIPDY